MRRARPGWSLVLPRAVAAAVALAAASGCATARNYDDPAGPVLVGQQLPRPHVAGSLRLVTFNIQWGDHVDRAADLLSRPGPLRDADVLFLQEVDGQGTESLARALDMNFVYVPSAVHPRRDRDFGVAILSPWPIADAQKIPLPFQHRFRKLRRAAAGATVQLPSGPLRVYAVHFETTIGLMSAEHRREQARAVLTAAMDWAGPIAIGGDLNSRAAGEVIAGAGFNWVTERLDHVGPLRDADHILVRGLCPAGDPSAGRPADETGASDHRPVWATVRPCDVAPAR